MYMVGIMTSAVMAFSTFVWIRATNFDYVLIYVITMGMVKMSIVKVVNVIAVLDGRVTTVWTMGVIVILMRFANHLRLQSL